MARFRSGRGTAALVVSVVALLVAVGGTSYAAFSIPARSVGTRQLKNGAVTGEKLQNGAVTATKIARGAVTNAGNAAKLGGLAPSAYVLGGGRLLFTRVFYPFGSGGTTLLTFPGLGRLETDCHSTGPVYQARYHNTSTNPEGVFLEQQDQNSETTGPKTLGVGGTLNLDIYNSKSNWERSKLSIGSGLGPAANVATASVWVHAGLLNDSVDGCFYEIQAAVQPG